MLKVLELHFIYCVVFKHALAGKTYFGMGQAWPGVSCMLAAVFAA